MRKKIKKWWEKGEFLSEDMFLFLGACWWITALVTIGPALYYARTDLKGLWLFGGPMIAVTFILALFHLAGIVKSIPK